MKASNQINVRLFQPQQVGFHFSGVHKAACIELQQRIFYNENKYFKYHMVIFW